MKKRSPALFVLLVTFCSVSGLQAQRLFKLLGKQAPTAGFETGFEHLQKHFNHYVDEGIFAGTAILLSQDGNVYTDTYGNQDIADQERMTVTTLVRLASMTKPITSVAVLMLMEDGKLHLDDPVYQYIPAFKDARVYRTETEWDAVKTPITIRHLLTHTGGITSGFDPSPAGQLWERKLRERHPKNLEELVMAIAELPLAFQPGEGWAYSYSTDILAYLVEQVSGKSFDQFLSERIFIPLKMNDTGFQVPTEKMDRFSTLYKTGPDQELLAADIPESSAYSNGNNFPRGNGGLVSSISDYHLFAQMLLHGGELNGVRLLKKKTVALMTR
ncbi:MAG: beta-lactamase family protein, partial [Lewinella sp.]|nr:beta-lactamase family protein [Lewinella sp.]